MLEGYRWDYETHMPIDCPNHCPKYCEDNEAHCFGGNDENGCPMPDHCIDQEYESTVSGI